MKNKNNILIKKYAEEYLRTNGQEVVVTQSGVWFIVHTRTFGVTTTVQRVELEKMLATLKFRPSFKVSKTIK